MVAEVRAGHSQRAVARSFGVSRATLQLWLGRARGERLDRVDWEDRSCAPHRTRILPREVEDLVLQLRSELRDRSDLGEYGALAIREELVRRHAAVVPSVRTIGRILERRGVLDAGRRVRRAPPLPGWYLPEVAAKRAELDSFDVVEGLVIRGGIPVEVLNALSLHGALPGAWPMSAVSARATVEALCEHWLKEGLPAYAQFDNDTRFHGPHHRLDTFGRVTRLCLSLAVTPVFVPPLECGFQAAIENFNGRWQAKVWARFRHDSMEGLRACSTRYIAAARLRAAPRWELAPERRVFPRAWRLDLQAPLHGRVIYLRRTTEKGCVRMLGRVFEVDAAWPHRLVRAELDLDGGLIRCYALRRRDPSSQPLLRELRYEPPKRPFTE